ncbi:MAG: type II toxin-antitoxin system Phd/YefM family antitoxin [Candidatus Aminicenantes bacterium]|nr:MAG: type II toxin-antitoxin system Phd/YefM family antitoxin [Candidatus Aminicenantes bacterium]
MKEVVTITEAKAKLSELINRICVSKEKISITRKGKPAVVILPIEEYERLNNQGKKGLIMANGVLADLDEEIDKMTESIYEKRKEETSRRVPL